MPFASIEFRSLVQAVVVRFYRQNAQAVPSKAELEAFASGLGAIVAERGLPPPLAAGDPGAPGGLPEAEITALVARFVPNDANAFCTDVARQLVKTCFYPEFTVCRDSYRECGKDGVCRRQDADRARRRVSGSHCVDCPYWVTLGTSDHEAFLVAAWHAGPDAFQANRAVFLPEDFRALRRWLWQHARAAE